MMALPMEQKNYSRRNRRAGLIQSFSKKGTRVREPLYDAVFKLRPENSCSCRTLIWSTIRENPSLLAPILENRADVVLGSRFQSGRPHRVVYFWHMVGNRLLTLFSNMLTNLNLTDIEACYKVFRRDLLNFITIEEDRFGFEPEIVAKLARTRARIYEVGISYYGRTYDQGKKISWKDSVAAAYAIVKYNVFRRGH